MAKWYPIYLDLSDYDTFSFQGAYNPFGSNIWHTIHRYAVEEIWQQVCECENIQISNRVKISAREEVDWQKVLSSNYHTPGSSMLKRIFILKCKSKQDFLHLKLALSRYIIDPIGIADKPRWLKNV